MHIYIYTHIHTHTYIYIYIYYLYCCCSVTKSYLTLCDPMTSVCQASLSFTLSQSLLQHTFIESVRPCNHLILLPPSPVALNKWKKWSGESHSVMSDSSRPHGLWSPWNSPGQNSGVGSLSLLQGIIPTQGSNPGLPHGRWILYQLSHKGNSGILECLAYPFCSGSSWPRNQTRVSCIAGGLFTNWIIRKAPSCPQSINQPINQSIHTYTHTHTHTHTHIYIRFQGWQIICGFWLIWNTVLK